MHGIKTIIKKTLNKVKYFIIHYIPLYVNYFFTNSSFKKELENKGIINPQPFKVNSWHFGYKYYIGEYSNHRVFIKYNSNNKWIEYEYKNFKYINDNSVFLAEKVPCIYSFNKYKKGAYIVEQYFNFESIERIIMNKHEIDVSKVYMDLFKILKESQRIDFKFLDLNPSNIFIDENSGVYIIDLGFSNINNDNYGFLDNKKMRKLIFDNLNGFSRIEAGMIDDAYSIIQICKFIDSNFMSKNYELWLELNKLMGISVFDKKEINHEN